MAAATSVVPAFYCPVPEAVHPAGDAVEARARTWMAEQQLAGSAAASVGIGVGQFLARCYPYCRREEYLDIAAALNYLGFVFDDAHVSESGLRTCAGLAPVVGRLLAVLDAPEATVTNPYQRALQHIVRRIDAVTTPANAAAVADGLRKALLYTLWHMSNWERGEMPSLNDYITIRINDDGAPWFNAFAPVCGEYQLPPTAARDPRIRALDQAVALAAGIDNDIYSFPREDAVGQKNILHILMRDHDCSLHEATLLAVDLRNRVMHLYARLRDQVTEEADPATARYTQDIGHIVRGNLQWSHTTARYRSQPADAPLITTAESRGIDPTPLPLPAAAWWWAQLPTISHQRRPADPPVPTT
ncbi:hypothetical protein AB0K68_18735 [Streptomyces sp. NPDC050698]